jgi:limonene-1,2-epoxide hydrolase
MSEDIAVVRAFLADVGDARGDQSAGDVLRRWLTDDCLWEQSGLPDYRGAAECAAFLDKMTSTGRFHTWTADHRALAYDPESGLVLSERVDHLVDASGASVGEDFEVCSAFRVRNGQISEWRDYFERP